MIILLPPNFEICIEGYNTEQVDFYISQLIEKINSSAALYEKSLIQIKRLEEENNNLRKDFLSLVSQINNFSDIQKKIDSISASVADIKTSLNCDETAEAITETAESPDSEDEECETEETVESKFVVAGVEDLQQELSSLKELLKK